MTQVVITGAARTPFGRFGGVYRDLSPIQLGATAVAQAIARSAFPPDWFDLVILGNCMGAATLGQVPGRQVVLAAGLHPATNVMDINTACTSAMVALELAFQSIRAGQALAAVAGGFESMSQVPYVLPGARFGYRLGHTTIVDSLTAALTCPITGVHMGVYAHRGAQARAIDRHAQDAWAVRSQQMYEAARVAGRLAEELAPVVIDGPKWQTTVASDEQPRADTTYEKLAALPPAFEPDGSITAGNAPGLNDGAAALVMAQAEKVQELGTKPLARVIAVRHVSASPESINDVPALAARAVLQDAGYAIGDIDLWEINEAFAAVTLSTMADLGIDPERVNVNGGSVAIGHPVGATGARIVMTLIFELRRRGGGRGLATICGAGASGCAVIVEVE